MRDRPQRRRFSLEVRLVAALLLIALVPLAVSAFVIDGIADVAQSRASSHAARLRPYLEDALETYRELIDAKKDLYREVARRLAASEQVAALAGPEPPVRLEAEAVLGDLLDESPDLLGAALVAPDDRVVAESERARPANESIGEFGAFPIIEPIPETDHALRLTFAKDTGLVQGLQDAGRAIRISRGVEGGEESLPFGYFATFLTLVGSVVAIVTAIGIAVARRITRRAEMLVSGTRAIASGNLSARVEIGGRDELRELAGAFNGMVEKLEENQRKIKYLERIGAWQDVARKLAHEIKNPLTPIRLTVQQLASKYDGGDERFQRMLRDTEEIVAEEIDALERLVDAFSALGRLPQVDPQPLDLGTVVEDLERDPVYADCLRVRPPDEPVTVRGDRQLLRRVLANLVENGMQAGEGSRVVVSWRPDEARKNAVLTVDDEGPGVPAEERERIFEPYVTKKETGTGLGLAISKKIAIDHRGALEVSPASAPTGGARFVLSIPLAGPDRE